MKIASRLKASIDMGTTKVSAMIADAQGGVVRVLGVGTAPSEGLKQGVVVDIDSAAGAVAQAVEQAEHMAGLSVETFSCGVAGEHIRSMNSRGVVAIRDFEEEITDADVSRAIDASRKFSLPDDREIIHTLPQEYIVDSQQGIRQPAGMFGSRLEARVHVVTASRPALDNVAKTLDMADIDLGEVVVEPLASSQAVLSDAERDSGALMLDIGGGTTDVMIYVDGAPAASGVIGLGGNDITSDIAYGLRTSPHHAEDIKVQHGCALGCLVEGDDVIEVDTIGARGSRRLARQLLCGIIEPRVTELFSLINDQITENGLKKSLGGGVVLTGGTSMLPGARELAEQVFDMPTRTGHPQGVEGLSEVVSHPRFATGVGLLLSNGGTASAIDSKVSGTRRLKHSFNQLRRAIAGFI